MLEPGDTFVAYFVSSSRADEYPVPSFNLTSDDRVHRMPNEHPLFDPPRRPVCSASKKRLDCATNSKRGSFRKLLYDHPAATCNLAPVNTPATIAHCRHGRCHGRNGPFYQQSLNFTSTLGPPIHVYRTRSPLPLEALRRHATRCQRNACPYPGVRRTRHSPAYGRAVHGQEPLKPAFSSYSHSAMLGPFPRVSPCECTGASRRFYSPAAFGMFCGGDAGSSWR
ncbi:hypothetical protein BS50DRAFT_173365 [Corynespora cassiicola Philippines]|uniref:Uncharacterized protein n=1 Tax=Corynespora cassiicola Philippines TaxID=1448308 RepID=A0A2T2P5G3_CORCC|nr:hypothetical protein BS50DRAFT_173365 [Corynespora cassiicola Philippines]